MAGVLAFATTADGVVDDVSLQAITRWTTPCCAGSSSNGPRYVRPASSAPFTSPSTSCSPFIADVNAPFET